MVACTLLSAHSVPWVLAVLTACAGSTGQDKTPSAARAPCAADADCVLTDMSNCCPACQEAPLAIPREIFERDERKCSVMDVNCSAGSERTQCPKVEPMERYVARCREGTCAAVKR